MRPIDLNSISYKHRFNGASLLISKANRLSGMSSPGDQKADDKALLAALAHYDMALALLKPFDPNYSTVVNWKCNVLRALRQFEEAVAWYSETNDRMLESGECLGTVMKIPVQGLKSRTPHTRVTASFIHR